MRGGQSRNWGLALVGGYLVFAVFAAILLAIALVGGGETPESNFLRMQYYSQVFLLAVLLFLALVAAGAVIALGAATYLTWFAKRLKSFARGKTRPPA